MRVILVSMPWALADRPSIQLGTLKAFADRHFSNRIHITAAHPYLSVERVLGRLLYARLAERSWLGEAVYAALLHPDRFPVCEKLFWKQWPRKEAGRPPDFLQIVQKIQQFHESMALWTELEQAQVVGLSVCFAQLSSSLYLARTLKARVPGVQIIVGGSVVSGLLGKSLMEAFPWIDFVISGEGEKPLVQLLSRFLSLEGEACQDGETWAPGIFYRTETGGVSGGGFSQITDVDSLPLPDYTDFFQEAHRSQGPTPIFALPIESSRGCWWHRARKDKPHKRACRFCNLNLQWRGYRSKEPERIAGELQALSEKYQCLRFVFVDNALHPTKLLETTQRIQRLGKDFDLFGEVRLPLSRAEVSALRHAGFRTIQAGIEAMSDQLLRRMGKGTRVIDNVAWMRHCEEFGIENRSNLLMEFPGSTPEDVHETLETLQKILIFRPLKGVRFWLGEGSPMAMDPRSHGIYRVVNHPHYAALFPEPVASRACFMVKSYRADREHQKSLWRPVWDFLRKWHRDYAAFRRSPGGGKPMLGYSDGGSFLLIRRRACHGRVVDTYRLRGISRDVYLSCLEPMTLEDIEKRYPRLSQDTLRAFFRDTVGKGLVFESHGWFLSLAVREANR